MNWLPLFVYGILTQNRIYKEIGKYFQCFLKTTVSYLEEEIRVFGLSVGIECTSVEGYKIGELIDIREFLGTHKKHVLQKVS